MSYMTQEHAYIGSFYKSGASAEKTEFVIQIYIIV